MNKRGAITLFIIIGMVFLILFSFAIYFQDYIKPSTELKKLQDVPNELKPIYSYVTACMEQATKQAVELNAIQGGFNDVRIAEDGTYLSTPLDISTEEGTIPFFIPYYVNAGQNLIPSEDIINSELKKRIVLGIYDCLDFSSSNYEVESQPKMSDINVEMRKDSFYIKMIYPLKVKIGDTTKEISLFEIDHKSIFPELYMAAKEFSEIQMESGNYICLTCMQDLADKYDLFIENAEFESYGDVAYIETEESINITELNPDHKVELMYFFTKEDFDNNNLTLAFIHILDLKNEYLVEGTENLGVDSSNDDLADSVASLNLITIPDQEIDVGYGFIYQVEAYGEGLSYYDNTDLFEIDELTGLIEFTPTKQDIGEHIIKIGIVDKNENIDDTSFILTVNQIMNKPQIEYIDYQEATVGTLFSYQINAIPEDENGTLTYFDDSDLFEIDKETGIIGFIPLEKDIGEHNIVINVIDDKGNSAEANMVLIIDEVYKLLE